MDNSSMISLNQIQAHIFTIRGMQVMIDQDLAEMYQVETRVLNQAVKRNIKRFPSEFMFQLSAEEYDFWKTQSLISQIVISKENRGGRRKLPYVFTEQGISMLSAVLKSNIAIDVSIKIMTAFVEMRKFINNNAAIFQRLQSIEKKQIEGDEKFEKIFKALEDKSVKPKQGIFYDGQIFDAYVFVSDLVKSAQKSILLIDNYIDESILQLFTKGKKNIELKIYTQKITESLKLDVKKYETQYSKIELTEFKKAHDRFLIIDVKEVYHFGASLKDIGKKWFAFSKMNLSALDIINKLEGENE